jgi:hypothetical protein
VEKTANQLWRQYRDGGGPLGFKDWLNRDKKKDFLNFTGGQQIPVNKPMTDSINQVIDSLHRQSGYQDSANDNYWLGIPKSAFLVSGAVILVGIALYFIYKKEK